MVDRESVSMIDRVSRVNEIVAVHWSEWVMGDTMAIMVVLKVVRDCMIMAV